MKNWRPNDWEGMPKCIRFSVLEPDFLATEVYEAGADAMLRKLYPYLLMSLGEMMRLESLIDPEDATHALKVITLIDELNEITSKKEAK